MAIRITTRTDGGARGNPGPAGLGAVIERDGKVVERVKRFLGHATNNVAEYSALIAALEAAREHNADEVLCLMDSKLIVEQMKGNYKVKNAELGKLYLKAWNLVQGFHRVEFRHVPREQNTAADALVNEAIDEGIRQV
jgi:ribonuclease HI